MNKTRICLTCPGMFSQEFLDQMNSNYEFIVAGCSIGNEEIIGILKDAKVLIMGGNETISPEVLEKIPPDLKFIFAGIEARTSFPGTWEDVKDRVSATGGGQAAVVETTLSQLTFLNPLRLQNLMAKNKKAPLDRKSILRDQTLLIVGAGTIGRKVMESAKGNFKKIIYTGGRGEKPELRELGFEYVPEFSDAFSLAEAISIHLELNPATEGKIGSEHLARIPKNAFLLDNARAGIISPEGLEAFLFNRPDVFVIFDEFYVNGELFRKAMIDPSPNKYQQIISFRNFWYSGHTASQGEMTKNDYSTGVLRILKDLGYIEK